MGRSDGDDFVSDVGRMTTRESTLDDLGICLVARIGRRCRFVMIGGGLPDYVHDFHVSLWPELLGEFDHNLNVFGKRLGGAIRG